MSTPHVVIQPPPAGTGAPFSGRARVLMIVAVVVFVLMQLLVSTRLRFGAANLGF